MSRLLLFGLALWGVGALQAGSIGPDCGSCFGATYTLETTGFVDNGNSTQTWGFTYKIDTSDAANSPTKSYYIGSVAVKVTSSNLTSNAVRLNSVSGTSGEKWAVSEANINNGGCDGSGQGWVCFSDKNPLAPSALANGPASYTWDFSVTMATGTLLNIASIQANYDSRTGKRTGKSCRRRLPCPRARRGNCRYSWLGWPRRFAGSTDPRGNASKRRFGHSGFSGISAGGSKISRPLCFWKFFVNCAHGRSIDVSPNLSSPGSVLSAERSVWSRRKQARHRIRNQLFDCVEHGQPRSPDEGVVLRLRREH